MQVVDLTQTISPTMPVYPGTEPPRFSPCNSYEADGFQETLLSMYSHTGTHVDPPAHIFAGRRTLDQFPAEQFVGKAIVIDCTHRKAGERITLDDLAEKKALADTVDFVLFRTDWDKHWGTDAYFGDYPHLAPELVDYLAQSQKKGVGLDVIGLDPIADSNLTLHKRLFSQGDTLIIENLTQLNQLPEGVFTFCALPLKYEQADGAPLRAIALL